VESDHARAQLLRDAPRSSYLPAALLERGSLWVMCFCCF
jgi:hypothetical protein